MASIHVAPVQRLVLAVRQRHRAGLELIAPPRLQIPQHHHAAAVEVAVDTKMHRPAPTLLAFKPPAYAAMRRLLAGTQGCGGHHAQNTNAGLAGGAHDRADGKRLYPALHLSFPQRARGYVTD
jgi:hypothetical protein